MVVAVALVAGGAGAAIGVVTNGNNNPSTTNGVQVLPAAKVPTASSSTSNTNIVTSVAAEVTPAIVDIQTTIATQSGEATEEAAGTGMIVTSSGEVLTNNHVIDDATSIKVTIQGHKGLYNAKVLGVDPPPSSDVALLQIEGYSGALPYVQLGNSSAVKVGQPVVAIGNALGQGGAPSVVNGIVSALNRTINASDETGSGTETLNGMIQTDAPIVPGDSGGPLVDAQGQVIGMDTAALSSTSGGATTFGFAIPINTARTIVTSIEHGQKTNGILLGESSYMGIFESTSSTSSGGLGFNFGTSGVTGNTGTKATTVAGVQIDGVATGSPAQTAGLAAGDVITAMNGKSTTTWAALTKIVAALHPGSTLSVSFTDSTGVPHTASMQLAGIPK
jgi:S1-C subfamily serine protease